MNISYPQLVKNFAEKLIFLYLECAETARFVTLKKRNELLVKYLKPMVKSNEYKPLRKDIKTLLLLARKNNGNVENQLIRLRSLVDKFDNDVEFFYSLLSQIEETLNLPSRIFDKSKPAEKHHVYVLGEHIDHAFSDEGEQIAPLALVVNSKRWTEIGNEVEKHGHFISEVSDSTPEKATIFLHPKARTLNSSLVA
ncbi:MAG: DUF2913 family protein [Endozoicomonadaceae bacterium]|nr:DUF2913 family protein [Endozoicomonadaceae bacterium]